MRNYLLISLIFIASLMAGDAYAQGRGAIAEAQRITGDRFAFASRTRNPTSIR